MNVLLTEHPIVVQLQKTLPLPAAVYIVGGAIRDALLGRTLNDLDFVVRGLTAQELETTLATLGKVNLVGKQFAVFKVKILNQTVDIALPRTDASFGTGKYKDVAVTADPNLPIEDDLKRRDFTINAMAWDVTAQTLIDPFDGQSDVSKKIIRCVGNPTARFQEDATRMLRAIRFAVQLDFIIEPQTLAAIKKLRHLFSNQAVSHHVLRSELIKAVTADPDRTLALCDELGVTALLLPDIPDATTMKRVGLLSLIKEHYGH